MCVKGEPTPVHSDLSQANFTMTMPKAEGDLAQEYFKDPYRFELAQQLNNYNNFK